VLVSGVEAVHDDFARYKPGKRTRAGTKRAAFEVFSVFRRSAPGRGGLHQLPVIDEQSAEGRTAKVRCFFKHRIEHRGEIAGPGVDDAQDFGNCGFFCLGLITLGPALDKLPLQIGDDLLRVRGSLVKQDSQLRLPRPSAAPLLRIAPSAASAERKPSVAELGHRTYGIGLNRVGFTIPNPIENPSRCQTAVQAIVFMRDTQSE
jgi:hypothetical protein